MQKGITQTKLTVSMVSEAVVQCATVPSLLSSLM